MRARGLRRQVEQGHDAVGRGRHRGHRDPEGRSRRSATRPARTSSPTTSTTTTSPTSGASTRPRMRAAPRSSSLTCKQVDFDHDGRKDWVVALQPQGQPARSRRPTSTTTASSTTRPSYDPKTGLVAEVERDTDFDGKFDVKEIYDTAGQLASVRRDRNGDGQPDLWEQYKDGVLIAILYDDDFDGKVDRREEMPGAQPKIEMPTPSDPTDASAPIDGPACRRLGQRQRLRRSGSRRSSDLADRSTSPGATSSSGRRPIATSARSSTSGRRGAVAAVPPREGRDDHGALRQAAVRVLRRGRGRRRRASSRRASRSTSRPACATA